MLKKLPWSQQWLWTKKFQIPKTRWQSYERTEATRKLKSSTDLFIFIYSSILNSESHFL